MAGFAACQRDWADQAYEQKLIHALDSRGAAEHYRVQRRLARDGGLGRRIRQIKWLNERRRVGCTVRQD